MKYLSVLTGVLFMAFIAVGCQDGNQPQAVKTQQQVYKGVIPCADCPGIMYQLSLQEDGTYQESRVYIGESSHRYTDTGTYEMKNDTLLVLHPEEGRKMLIGMQGDKLTMLDQDGNPIEGPMASNYILHKVHRTSTGSQWEDQRADGIDFRASGNEPFWGLQVDLKDKLTFHLAGGDSISVDVPKMKADTANKARYWMAETKEGLLKVRFAPVGCLDSMSGQLFNYGVQVIWKGKTYKGCGNFINPKAQLNEFWTLRSIQDSTVTSSSNGMGLPALHFNLAEQTVTGYTGCNLLNGSFTVSNGDISFSKMITTKRACLNSGQIEQRFLAALKKVKTYRVDNARLYLMSKSDTLMVFQHAE